jgi:hypothetical protein
MARPCTGSTEFGGALFAGVSAVAKLVLNVRVPRSRKQDERREILGLAIAVVIPVVVGGAAAWGSPWKLSKALDRESQGLFRTST